MVQFNAVILAGGRASRLGGIDKTGLVFDGSTLLEHARAAVHGALSVAVVGGSSNIVESPRFAGPAAAAITGLDTLPKERFTAVLAADQPRIAFAMPLLLALLEASPLSGGVVAVDESGRRQPLLAVYSTALLARAGAEARSRGRLDNLGMSALTASIHTLELRLPDGLCADVDTPADAHALGIAVERMARV